MAGKAWASSLRPCNDSASVAGVASGEHQHSTAWSTERIAVENNKSAGVCSVAPGSRMAVRGTISRCANICFARVRLSVMPAMAVKSGADSVVETDNMRIASAGGVIGRATSAGAPAWNGSNEWGVVKPCQKQTCTAFAASIAEPPPMPTSKSALHSRAAAAAASTSSRGLWARTAAKEPACRGPSARAMRCTGPSASTPSERPEIKNTRCAPSRTASASTASPAGTPCTMRSCAAIMKVPACKPG